MTSNARGRGLFCCVAVALAAAAVFVTAARADDPSVRQAARTAMQQIDVDWPWLAQSLAPEPRNTDHVLDGRIRREHPRILLPELFAWEGSSPARPIVRRRALYETADRHMLDGLCVRCDARPWPRAARAPVTLTMPAAC